MVQFREAGLEGIGSELEYNVQDEFRRLAPVSGSSKVKAFDCQVDNSGAAKVLQSECPVAVFFK